MCPLFPPLFFQVNFADCDITIGEEFICPVIASVTMGELDISTYDGIFLPPNVNFRTWASFVMRPKLLLVNSEAGVKV